MSLRGLLKIAMGAMFALWFIATCLGHAGFAGQWFMAGGFFLAINFLVTLWFLKVDATDRHLNTR